MALPVRSSSSSAVTVESPPWRRTSSGKARARSPQGKVAWLAAHAEEFPVLVPARENTRSLAQVTQHHLGPRCNSVALAPHFATRHPSEGGSARNVARPVATSKLQRGYFNEHVARPLRNPAR